MNKEISKGIILLSGGLDSIVSLHLAKEKYNIKLAITFDYGQRSVKQEIATSEKIARFYRIDHKIIRLDWLSEISSRKTVWIPNRNGLFLNIAACYADAKDYDYIIFGANKEEAKTFSDNSQDFIGKVNAEFQFSTQKKPTVVAPLVNMCKNEIVRIAMESDIPMTFIRSCYKHKSSKHCGECESCKKLKSALEYNKADEHIKELFDENTSN